MYAECTLLAASLAASHEVSSSKPSAVKACVQYLQDNEFIARTTVTDSGNQCFTVTMTTCLENLEMSGIFAAVREM